MEFRKLMISLSEKNIYRVESRALECSGTSDEIEVKKLIKSNWVLSVFTHEPKDPGSEISGIREKKSKRSF